MPHRTRRNRRYLAAEIGTHPALELAFVWNRSRDAIPPHLPILENLGDFAARGADLIVEMAHPAISREYAAKFLKEADYMPGSPSCFADRNLEAAVAAAAAEANGHGCYVPRGALPGLGDVLDMAGRGDLARASVTMKKDPPAIKWAGPEPPPEAAASGETTLFAGSVRDACVNAPNNVNTMAVLALASGLGLDAVAAKIVVDPASTDHVVEVRVEGHPRPDGSRFTLDLKRTNPADPGAVTGSATYASFFASLLAANGAGDGIHFR